MHKHTTTPPRSYTPPHRRRRCRVAHATRATSSTHDELSQALNLLAGAADREAARATEARRAAAAVHLLLTTSHTAAAQRELDAQGMEVRS